MILPYETIFSRSLSRIDDPKELALDSNDFVEIYTERLHNVLGDTNILNNIKHKKALITSSFFM